MSLSKRSSPSPPSQNSSTRDLKQRIISCLNKLSDRDTYSLAVTELDSIARNLTHDSYSTFLNCIYFTDSSQKSPVRKQCVRLLSLISQIHGDSLSPFLSKMVSNIVRRLRDSDSTVRASCVDAVKVMAAHITKPSFSVFLKPLTEAILLEQDQNSQTGSALCLASAIDASPDPQLEQLQRFLPKFLKLLRTESFKAKPALLSLISSIIGAGGASSHNVLVNLIPCIIEFLKSEHWASRRAAAEALTRLAVQEKDLLSEFKGSCLSTVESRRFDKIKLVRDAMNTMLGAWKEVPDEVSQPSQSKSSSRGNAGSRSSVDKAFESPESRNKASPTPVDASSATTVRQRSSLKRTDLKSSPPMFRKLDRKNPGNWKVDHSSPRGPMAVGEDENDRGKKLETRRAIFNDNDDKVQKTIGLRSGSHVVQFHQECPGSTIIAGNVIEEIPANQKTNEDISLIRMQLGQIENQQSSLFDLLQNFIGSSQNGMRTLETRVHGLEMALDEISYDLAVSTGRMSNPETAGNTCCSLPGADFLSSKFWKRTEARNSTSKFSSSVGTPSVDVIRTMADRDRSAELLKLESRMLRHQTGGGFVVNPLANIPSESMRSSEVYLNRMPRNANQESDGLSVDDGSRLDVPLQTTGILRGKGISRSST